MCPEVIRDLCVKRGLYEKPSLNSKMYLHCMGFRRIEALDQYLNVKALFLDSNAIEKIENLDRLLNLQNLNLSQNLLERIEGLEFNVKLQRLNLSSNDIVTVENLSHLVNLEELNLSRNRLVELDDELHNLTKLSNLDVSFNKINTADKVMDFFKTLDTLKQLKFFGNPACPSIAHFRQKITNALPELTYLDDRPIFEVDKVGSQAWATGGALAEKSARMKFLEEQRKAPPTEDWEDRKHRVSERMATVLARLDSEAQQNQKESNLPSNGNLLDDMENLERYAAGWRQIIEHEGEDTARMKCQLNRIPSADVLSSTRPSTATTVDSMDEEISFTKMQFDDEAFHKYQARELEKVKEEQREQQYQEQVAQAWHPPIKEHNVSDEFHPPPRTQDIGFKPPKIESELDMMD